jgi:hypothetical protein
MLTSIFSQKHNKARELEILINRRPIEDAQGEYSATPDKVLTIKRPF